MKKLYRKSSIALKFNDHFFFGGVLLFSVAVSLCSIRLEVTKKEKTHLSINLRDKKKEVPPIKSLLCKIVNEQHSVNVLLSEHLSF